MSLPHDVARLPSDGAAGFGAMLRRAAAAAGLNELLRRRKDRLTYVMILARSINAFGFGLLLSASMNMIYMLVEAKSKPLETIPDFSDFSDQQNDVGTSATPSGTPDDSAVTETSGNTSPSRPMKRQTSEVLHRDVQLLQTNIGTVATLLDFFAGPIVGQFSDAYGRLPTMLLALACTGTSRLCLALKPSLPLYVLYRIFTALTQPAFYSASTAALGDLHGRGTPAFTEASSMVGRYALLASILGTRVGGMIKKPVHCFIICGTMQLGALAALASAMQETLPSPSKMQWSMRRASPLSFIVFFRRSPALVALAVLTTVRLLPDYGNIDPVYRRQRFGKAYGRQQESNQMTISLVVGFLSTFMKTRLLELWGLELSTRVHSWLRATSCAISALAPRTEFFCVSPFLGMFQCGGEAVNRCLQQEAHLVGRGQGELAAAESNMLFLPSLVMPHAFTRLYTFFSETFPACPYLVEAAMHIFAAEFATKWAFGQLSPSVRKQT